MYRNLASFLALAATVSGASIGIDVGQDGSLKFNPDSVTAAMGDTLEFHFYSGSGGHSVVSSSFSTPCIPATDAFFSGYITGDASGDQTFVVTVNSTDPIWFYCSLAGHCQEGMVGVVNPPSGQTVDDYANAAQSVTKASAPATLQGGVLTSINPSAATSSSSPESTNTIGRQTSGAASVTTTSMASTSPDATNTVGRQSTAGTASPTSGAVGSNTNSREPSSTSASASAATTSASAGVGIRERSDVGAVMGLAVFAGGLVALMA